MEALYIRCLHPFLLEAFDGVVDAKLCELHVNAELKKGTTLGIESAVSRTIAVDVPCM